MCKIDGCVRESRYKKQDVCQMHYFRFMRTGSYNRKPLKYRTSNPKGYQMIMKPNHPLSHKSGYVYEHRYVLHKDIGDSLSCCELCGESVTWKSVHVDHIDRDVTNNKRDNLRPLCRVCNTRRDRLEACLDKNNKAITWFGETKTPEEWGRDSRVPVKGHTIRQRLSRGLSVKESLFMEKKTHNKLTA